MKKNRPLPTALVIITLIFAALFSGAPVAQETSAETQPEPLRIDRYPSYYYYSVPLTPDPNIILRFNAAVSPADVRKHVSFRERNSKRRVLAEVFRPSAEEVKPLQPYGGSDEKNLLAVDHFVSLRPLSPLPTGASWQLEIKSGLSSVDGTRQLAKTRTDRLGRLSAFEADRARAVNLYDSPKSINISFNKSLHESITSEALAEFVHLQPQPANLTIEKNGSLIRLKGDFENGHTYRASVWSGLVASDRTRLETDFAETVKFEANSGFVTLPAFTKAQNASGSKQFNIKTGNLDGVHVRVKKLNDRDLVYALRGYEKLYEGNGGSKQQIPFEMVPGRTIYDQHHTRTAEIDCSESVSLSWPQLLDGSERAALYVCAEGKSVTRKQLGIGAQAIIQLTDIGLAWKQDNEEMLLFTFSLQTGEPLKEIGVELLDGEAEPLADLVTDANGIARIPDAKGRNAKWIAARNGKDRHIVQYRERMNTIGLWRFSMPYRYYDNEGTERRALLFTDRPVYKPGERVYLKCLSRLSDFDTLLPVEKLAGTPATLKIRDARGRTILNRRVTLSEFGSFDDSFDLPEEKTLGWYSVEVDFTDSANPGTRQWRNRFHHRFQVAEYRPNTFEIAIEAEEDYQAAKELKIPVTAKYFMGKPLSKAQLQWHVSAWPSYPALPGFENFRFGDTLENRPNFTASQTVNLGEEGETRIEFELPEQSGSSFPRQIRLNTEITDVNQQTVAETASFMVHSSDFYLGIRKPEGVLRAGDEIPLSIAAIGSDAAIFDDPIEATLKIEKRVFTTVKVKSAGGRIATRTDEQRVTVREEIVTIQSEEHPQTGTPKASVEPVTLAEAGDYLLTLSAIDEKDNPVLTRTQIRIAGADEPAWNYHDDIRIDVTADKESYRVGDTARLLVRSPIFGHALVTTERGGVQSTTTREISEHESVIDVPIREGAAPNLFASVMIVRGSDGSPHRHPNTDYRIGYCQLNVEDPSAKLDVTLETGDAEYALPGSAVDIAALVRDATGEPVPNTEVTLYAVDEGVLSLTGYVTPDPGKVFNAPFPLSVRTGQSISDLLAEDPNDQYFDNKGYVIGGGGGKGAGIDPARIRKNFKALAYWGGAMITGPDGRVRASFTAPDNLTTYRVIAVASSGNRFGSGEGDLVINKPLIIEPALPAFGNVADEIDLTAVLHNNTDDTLDLEIQVELDRHAEFIPERGGLIKTGLTNTPKIADDPTHRTRRLTLRGGETNTFTFPVLFTRKGEAKWTWKTAALEDPELADAMESKLDIGYPIPLLRNVENVTITEPEAPTDLLASVDSKLLTGAGDVRVSLSNSRVIEAMDALSYLLRYPYGCVEQTTSSTLPWLSTQRLRDALPQLDRTEAEIADAVSAGTRRLLSMQTREGGLAYWPGHTEPILWGSAWGGMALALAERNGNDLPKERLDALWKWLSGALRNSARVSNSSDLYHRCLGAYTLAIAGKAEPAYHEVLFEKRRLLSLDSRAILALAMIEAAGEERNSAIDDRIKILLTEDRDGAEESVVWKRKAYASATQLHAWSRWDPLNSRATELVNDLMDAPRTRAAWGNTFLNCWGLMALAAHTDSAATRLDETLCTVRFGDDVREMPFGRKIAGFEMGFAFEGDERETPLEVRTDSPARLYAHVEVETQPAIAAFEAENHGFGIDRTYHKLDAAGEVHPVDSLEVGDLVLITLHLSIPEKERFEYLAVDDPLPSIFEAVNPNFKSQAGDQKTALKGRWKRLYVHHSELRKDRALFFCNYLSQGGDYAVQYLARVVAPGSATAPPAKIEAMYEPHRYGLSATNRITAKPLQLRQPENVAQN